MGISTGTTATTTQANEVCIGCIGFSVNKDTDSPSNSFTEVTETGAVTPNLTVLERIVSATGEYGTSVTWTGSAPISYSLCGAIATFKEAGSNSFNTKNSSAFLLFN